MAEKKEAKTKTSSEKEKPEVRQSATKAILIGLGAILVSRFIIVGGLFGDLLATLGVIFLIVGIIQFFQDRKAKKEKDNK
jgi:predicted phage tail protein